MRTLTVLSAALLTLAFAGCKPSSAPPATSDPAADASQPAAPVVEPPATTAPAPDPASTSGATLTVDPAEMQDCDKTPRVATLTWDASPAPGVEGVEIWMSNRNKDARLFARARNVGEKQTGAWILAGASFTLKNQVDGTEIARTEVRSIPCE